MEEALKQNNMTFDFGFCTAWGFVPVCTYMQKQICDIVIDDHLTISASIVKL